MQFGFCHLPRTWDFAFDQELWHWLLLSRRTSNSSNSGGPTGSNTLVISASVRSSQLLSLSRRRTPARFARRTLFLRISVPVQNDADLLLLVVVFCHYQKALAVGARKVAVPANVGNK